MRLSITQKISLGFATMVVFIIIVGGGGLYGDINTVARLHQVTDDVLPSLTGSFRQMIRLQEANQSLYSALAQDSAKELREQGKLFDERLKQFNSELETLQPLLADDPQLSATFDTIQSLSQQFNTAAQSLMDDQKERLILDRRVTEAEIKFQSLSDSLVAWTQRYTGTNDFSDGILLAREMTRALSTHKFQLINYVRSHEIEELNSALERSKGALRGAYDNFAKIEPKAKQIISLIDDLEGNLYGDSGLVAFYRQRVEVRTRLAAEMTETNRLINASSDAGNALIAEAAQKTERVRKEADEAAYISEVMIVALALGAVVVALLVAIVTTNTLRRPLAQIRKQLASFSEGDLRVHFDDKRQDEFGELGASLNSVVDNLKEILEQMANGSQRLSDVASKNASISQKATRSMSHQNEQLELTASAATELESSVSEVAEHSSTTLRAVQECETLTRNVNKQVSDTLTSIQAQASGIDQAVGVSNELAGFSNEIGSILTTIQNIAEKTNLLALNAAIEAARAGDHGRGFAVVADEVRQLASQTQNSIHEIQHMVESMQSSIKRVVHVMGDSSQQANQCVSHANASQMAWTR